MYEWLCFTQPDGRSADGAAAPESIAQQSVRRLQPWLYLGVFLDGRAASLSRNDTQSPVRYAQRGFVAIWLCNERRIVWSNEGGHTSDKFHRIDSRADPIRHRLGFAYSGRWKCQDSLPDILSQSSCNVTP